jgi:hypothetical protein
MGEWASEGPASAAASAGWGRWGHMNMNWRLSIAAVAALIALGETAKAEILEAGPASAGAAQNNGTVTCKFFNAGSNAASIVSWEIWNAAGVRQQISDDTCGNPLAPQKFCQYVARAVYYSLSTYTCRAVTSGVEENISGTMQTDQLLLSIPVRK